VTAHPEPAEYLAEHLRNAIAEGSDIHEQGIVVHVTGDRVLLTGSAPSEAQRDAIGTLVRREAPDHHVVNEVTVPSTDPPTGAEQL
jgi:osmotically-inducible protein OsmY